MLAHDRRRGFVSRNSLRFWSLADQLLNSSEIVIDRPQGTAHPRMPHITYPLDYGYLKNTSAGDG